jgi:hypothetical protein
MGGTAVIEMFVYNLALLFCGFSIARGLGFVKGTRAARFKIASLGWLSVAFICAALAVLMILF